MRLFWWIFRDCAFKKEENGGSYREHRNTFRNVVHHLKNSRVNWSTTIHQENAFCRGFTSFSLFAFFAELAKIFSCFACPFFHWTKILLAKKEKKKKYFWVLFCNLRAFLFPFPLNEVLIYRLALHEKKPWKI